MFVRCADYPYAYVRIYTTTPSALSTIYIILKAVPCQKIRYIC